MDRNYHLLLILSLLFTIVTANAAEEAVPFKPRSEERPDISKKKPFTPKPQPELRLPPVEKPSGEPQQLPAGLYITVNKFEFMGNTVFSDAALDALVSQYKNRPLSSLDLEELRLSITNHYISQGYINSGALIPDQNLEQGTLILQIIEGKLNQISVLNEGKLPADYIAKRVQLDKDQVLNIADLQEKLFLLQQNPSIKQVNASLSPGAKLGESVLDMRITEDRFYHATFQMDNHSPPSVGEARGFLDFTYLNLVSAGDTINLHYSGTEGSKEGGVNYLYPISADDTMVRLEYTQGTFEIIDDTISNVEGGIDSDSYSAKIGIYVPMVKTANEEFNFEVLLDQRQSESKFVACGDNPFDGEKVKCNLTALRLTQSWFKRDLATVYFFRHTISAGLKALNSTIGTTNTADADSRFTKWLGQFQWAKRFSSYNLQTLFRTDLQISDDHLMSMEQFVAGGANTVRGYRENQLVRDNGFIASLELRAPIYRRESNKQTLLAVIFADYGSAWNYNEPKKALTEITSVGLGLKWEIYDRVSADVYWAYPHSDLNETTHAWQDHSVHALLKINLL